MKDIASVFVLISLFGCASIAKAQQPGGPENAVDPVAIGIARGHPRTAVEVTWMKRENPWELRAILDLAGQSTSRCPSRHEHYQQAVNAALERSGIVPASEVGPNPDFILVVQLICHGLASQPGHAFTLTTHFGRLVGGESMLFADQQETASGVGSDEEIVDAIQNITGKVIADYLVANFAQ